VHLDHPDDTPPAGLATLEEAMRRLGVNMNDALSRLVINWGDPEGQLAQFSQMIALKRGSRR
jgi:hypothetical protein